MIFVGLIVFIILTFVQPQEFMPGIKGMPLVYMTMAFVAFVWYWRTSIVKKTNFGKAQQNILMALFCILIGVSTAKVSLFPEGFTAFIGWFKVIIIYFAMISIIDKKNKLKAVIGVIVFSMAVTAVIGILQYYGIDLTGEGTIDGRITGVGIFGTNQLAYALVFCFPLAFGLFSLSSSFITKFFIVIILLIYSYCLYLTQSRGGLLCLLFVILITFFIFSRKKIVKITGLIFCIFFFSILVQFAPRFSSTFEYKTDKSALGRLDVWGEALMALKSSPIFGIGKEQFAERFKMASHSSYIQTVTELGLLGLFIWLALFYYSLKNLSFIDSNINSNDKRDIVIISKSLQISLYAYLIGSYFSSSAYYIPLYMLFAFAVILQRMSGLFKEYRFKLKDIIAILAIEAVALLFIHILAKTTA